MDDSRSHLCYFGGDSMELTWITTAIVSAAFFMAGIIDAVSGGGGLLTLPTFLLLGFPVHLIAEPISAAAASAP